MNVARKGDAVLGHEAFPPTTIEEGSPDVFCNGKEVARLGDSCGQHQSPEPQPPHPRKISSGSPTVFANSKKVAMLFSAVDCGGMIIQGSPDTYAES